MKKSIIQKTRSKMIITKTMFHLYLVRLGLYNEKMEESPEGFYALLSKVADPESKFFSRIENLGPLGFSVYLKKTDIQEREQIKSLFMDQPKQCSHLETLGPEWDVSKVKSWKEFVSGLTQPEIQKMFENAKNWDFQAVWLESFGKMENITNAKAEIKDDAAPSTEWDLSGCTTIGSAVKRGFESIENWEWKGLSKNPLKNEPG